MKKVPKLKKKSDHALQEDSLAAALNWDKLGLTDSKVFSGKQKPEEPIEDLIRTIEGR